VEERPALRAGPDRIRPEQVVEGGGSIPAGLGEEKAGLHAGRKHRAGVVDVAKRGAHDVTAGIPPTPIFALI